MKKIFLSTFVFALALLLEGWGSEKTKEDTSFELIKYSSDKKEKKSKGEVVDSWYSLKLTKKF